MEIREERNSGLQTQRLSRIVLNEQADRFSGVETLDLSVEEPEPTAHLALTRTDGVTFQKRKSRVHFSGAWALDDPTDLLQFKLTLPHQFGLVLILHLCRTVAAKQSDHP